jgi:hypothetical protein
VFDGATGIGLVDRTIIDTLQRLGANSDGRPVRGAALLADLDTQGIPPSFAYEHISLSTQSDLCWIRLYRPRGNLGSRGFPPASPRYVEISLSEVGELLATDDPASRLPVGFINGNIHVEGTRPAFQPTRVLDAIVLAASSPRVSDAELVDIVGPPAFPAGCSVEGDFDALHAGEEVTLTLTARLVPDPTGTELLMTGMPPVVNPDDVIRSLAQRGAPPPTRPPGSRAFIETRIPLRDINDRSRPGEELYVLIPTSGTELEELRSQVLEVWGVSTAVRAHLPASTPVILRHHAQGEPNDVIRAAQRLRELIAPGQ